MAESMREAFFKTEDGKEFVAQNNPREIARRMRELKDLVHSTFVTNVPDDAYHGNSYQIRNWDLFVDAKPRIRELGKVGGEEYEKVCAALKYAWTPIGSKNGWTVYDKAAYQDAVKVLMGN